jgi:DNA polymerase elongation subunit (family B)
MEGQAVTAPLDIDAELAICEGSPECNDYYESPIACTKFYDRARTGYPAALRELREARQEIERLRALLDEVIEMGLADYESAAYYVEPRGS